MFKKLLKKVTVAVLETVSEAGRRRFKGKIPFSYILSIAMLVGGFVLPETALADYYDVQISQIEMNNNGLFVNDNGVQTPAIFVRGTFTPALPCAVQGFFILASDPYEKETVAMLLAAKTADRLVTIIHSYCHANGYSRSNGYNVK